MLFRHLKPDGTAELSAAHKSVGVRDKPLTDAVFDAVSLADSAAMFFCGVFPVEAPYFAWGDGMKLPWRDDYWVCNEDARLDQETFHPRPIDEEIAQVARELDNLSHGMRPEPEMLPLTYSSDALCKSERLRMQGLAVETMLAVDCFLALIAEKRFPESIPWLSAAYKMNIECVCQAQAILGYSSVQARNAAYVRHRENHQMRAQVDEWYADHKHEFKSMDAAAEAAAGKIVPVSFRTVRSWIGDWARKQRPARRP